MVDKFYTLPHISKECIDIINIYYPLSSFDLIIEPSAGNGSFFNHLKNEYKILAMDILPECEGIIKQDYFSYNSAIKGNVLVVGNPPFGRVSSLAVKFFNHSSTHSNVIAFILPRTFRRVSIQSRLNPYFHIVHDIDIPEHSFTPDMQAKCCFQIWEKKEILRRHVILPTSHTDWVFLPMGPMDDKKQPTPPISLNPHFALRAYGGKCGEIVTENLHTLRPKSWHWIKSNIPIQTLIERFKSLDFSLSQNTARQNSLGKAELIKVYSEKY